MTRLEPAAARVRPSGENASVKSWSRSLWIGTRDSPVAGFQSVMSPPSSADARIDPSGANATAAHFLRLRKTRLTCPVATSQSRTVRSFDAEARVRPSGLNATERTWSV